VFKIAECTVINYGNKKLDNNVMNMRKS